MEWYRVREEIGPCVVSHPQTEQFIAPDRGKRYRADDPLVTAHPWLFIAESDLADGVVEAATAAPGIRRRIVRRDA